jgi:hypothetical protein
MVCTSLIYASDDYFGIFKFFFKKSRRDNYFERFGIVASWDRHNINSVYMPPFYFPELAMTLFNNSNEMFKPFVFVMLVKANSI